MANKRELCFSLRKIQMEGLRRSPLVGAAGAVVMCFLGMMVQEVSATRWIVGGYMGWTNDVNYTVWAQNKQFYNGDWLFFVYDRNQKNVLEVNKTDYEACNSDHPLHNWTTGAGRDVVPLNVTRDYYFISGKGFCYGGMKLAVQVENLPPPPSSSPLPLDQKNSAPPARTHDRSCLILQVALAAGVVWKAFPWLW